MKSFREFDFIRSCRRSRCRNLHDNRGEEKKAAESAPGAGGSVVTSAVGFFQ